MGTTYTSLTYHVVYSTKYRRKTIRPDLQDRLYEYIGGIIRADKGVLLEIGGIEDHIHLLAGFPPTISVSDMVGGVKANSSRWVNEQPDRREKFAWQTGYGAFTVSQSQVDVVRNYIRGQEKHHRQLSFRDEFIELLKRHNIKYDLQYVFDVEHHG